MKIWSNEIPKLVRNDEKPRRSSELKIGTIEHNAVDVEPRSRRTGITRAKTTDNVSKIMITALCGDVCEIENWKK